MEGALNWALPQQGVGRGEGPQVVPRSLPWPGEEEAFHYTPHPQHTHSRGVYAGIPAWTGGRHFLGMANSVPQPNHGAEVGCDGQRFQEREQAPGGQDVFRSDLRAGSL